jgi:tRNA A37 threonylcarbamoyladenosine dehydratase
MSSTSVSPGTYPPSSLRESLTERFDARTFRPHLFTLDAAGPTEELGRLLASGQVRSIHDRLKEQVAELVTAERPELGNAPEAARHAADAVLDGVPAWRFGTWAWYPWSGRLVHVLPRELFRRVRTDRNRDKITREQQAALFGRRIGVIGLSVGNCAALTLAMEGVAGAFRLADFDRVGLSNLNRLRTTVAELGVDKTVVAARQLYEIDPYLDVELYPQGLTEQTVGAFFAADDSGRGVDLLVEECDTPWVKVAAREHARRAGTPVLMDTNDRGMLDVERFDLEPERPLLHGRLHDVTSDSLRQLTPQAGLELLLRMVDADALSPAMVKAVGQIGHSLSSWPQLASGVMLGGALVTDVARRILLGHPVASGRYYADLSELIPDAPVRHAETSIAPPRVRELADAAHGGHAVHAGHAGHAG